MAQTITLVSEAANDGSWFGTVSTMSDASDATYYQGYNTTNGTVDFNLSSISAPDPGTQSMSLRYNKNTSSGYNRTIQVQIVESGSVVWTSAVINVTSTTFNTSVQTITTPPTNWANCVVRFVSGGTVCCTTASRRYIRVQEFSITTPDGSAPPPPAVCKVWNGSAWVEATPKIYQSGSWVTSQGKVWDGTQWR